MSPAKFLAAIAFAALVAASPARAEKIRTHFDTDSAGRVPGFFDLVVWGAPGEAEWIVLGDVNPPSTPNKLIQARDGRPEDSLAVALRRTYSFADGEVSVGLRRGGGRAGLVLRSAGDKDFLALLVNGRTGDARLVSWKDGKPTELAQGKATTDREWSTLSVRATGASITASWNGKPLLSATDPHPRSGGVGLATAGPGQASFDELVFDGTAASPR
jgi:hypothetical protein